MRSPFCVLLLLVLPISACSSRSAADAALTPAPAASQVPWGGMTGELQRAKDLQRHLDARATDQQTQINDASR